jgi:hypothetical protein
VKPPCVVERVRSGVERLAGPQHEAKPATWLGSLVLGRVKEEPSLSPMGELWKVFLVLERTLRNLPGWGAWNGQMVVLGTGEALLGSVLRGREAVLSITGGPGSDGRPRGSRRGSWL